MGKLGFLFLVFFFVKNLGAQEFDSAIERARQAQSLLEKLTTIREVVYQVKNFSELVKFTQLVFEEVSKNIPADFDIDEVKGNGKKLIQLSFDSRMKINGFLNEYKSQIEPPQLFAISNFQRLLRSIEDLVGEYTLESERLEPKLAFEGGAPFQLWNPKFAGVLENYIPRSGDVIMTRGTAFSSAAIARMGDRDGQFTHQAMVYVAPDGKIFTLESHIEVGNDVFQWSNFVKNKARSVVFRHRDPEFGPKAATYLYELLSRARKNGKLIPYDFKLKYGNSIEFYCSELVHHGYDHVGAPVLPTAFFNKLTKLGKKTLRQLGVEADSFIAPSDMELDPNFELVVEWRDYSKTQDTRQKDVVMDAIYDLIQNKQYLIFPSMTQKFLALFLKVARVTPISKDYLKEKFPTNMPHRTLALMVVLNKIVTLVAKEIKDFDLIYYQAARLHAPNAVLLNEAKRILLDKEHPLHRKLQRYFRASDCVVELVDAS